MHQFYEPLSPARAQEMADRILGLRGRDALLWEAQNKTIPPNGQQPRFEDGPFIVCCLALSGRNFHHLYPNQAAVRPHSRGIWGDRFLKKLWEVCCEETFIRLGKNFPSRIELKIDIGEALRIMEDPPFFWPGLRSAILGLASSGRDVRSLKQELGCSSGETPMGIENIFFERIKRAFIAQYGPPRGYIDEPRTGTVVELAKFRR